MKITAIPKTAEEITGVSGMISFHGNNFAYIEELNEIALKGERMEFESIKHPLYDFQCLCRWGWKRDWLKDIQEVPDIRPASELADLPVDTKILVGIKKEDITIKRHFAFIKNGRIWTWRDGRTSWSEDSVSLSHWEYAKLPDSDIIYKSEGVE